MCTGVSKDEGEGPAVKGAEETPGAESGQQQSATDKVCCEILLEQHPTKAIC